MISSTRSRESASRSSWNDASSVISASSTPSCSVRTSLTRSKTSSRDAAMSPQCGFGGLGNGSSKTARSYTDALGEPLREPLHDAVLDAPRREPDGVRNGAPAAVSMRDHGEPAEAEQVGAAVGVGVEPGA